ncbi:MAG: hypothetical protein U0736_21650 [Gemmataceae bacterium]
MQPANTPAPDRPGTARRRGDDESSGQDDHPPPPRPRRRVSDADGQEGDPPLSVRLRVAKTLIARPIGFAWFGVHYS